VRLEGRRHGWLVKGRANGVSFESYIGERWGRFFLTVDDALRSAAKIAVGDELSVVIEPTATASAYAKAREQSKVTTQPKRPRPDAVDFSAARVSERGIRAADREPRR
jgi:hypothetical protein